MPLKELASSSIRGLEEVSSVIKRDMDDELSMAVAGGSLSWPQSSTFCSSDEGE